MSNNVYGAGSWSKQVKNGTEYHRLVVRINGKRKDFYGKTKAEAQKKYKNYLINHNSDTIKTSMSIYDVAKEAIKLKKQQIKETTYDYYLAGADRLKKDGIGNFQIQSVTIDDVQIYINNLSKTDTLSTIKRQKIILNIAFSYANNHKWIDDDFMDKIKLPNEANIVKEKKQPVFLSTEERRLIEVESNRLNDNKVHNGKIGTRLYGVSASAIVFILHTGLRVGELFALYWKNVDLDKRFIHITQNAPTGGKTITTPKRKSSIRSIPIDSVAFDILQDLSNDKNGELVFHTKNGNMLNRNDVHRTLKTMIERTGINKNPTLHDLRHTYASELIRNGIDMKTVSVLLGHSDISTTMNIYVHKSESDLEIVRDILK